MDWMYGTEADEWSDWLPEDSLTTVRFNGCYMKKLFPGLRLISLNNILGNPYNVFLYINQTDPDGTMTWLISQLLEAEKAGDKVQIVAHIPGGSMESLEGWSLNYYKAVNRFEDTIVAQFFGHTHSEELNVYYEDLEDPKSRPTAVVYSAGSVTPNYAFNPSYRIYTIDGNYPGSSYQILDWESHFLNLTTANANPDAPTNWEILYPSVKEQYDLNSLSPSEWSNLIIKMVTNDTLYSNYHKNRYRRDHVICHSDCRRNTLCTMRIGHHTSKMCNDIHPKNGINGKYAVEKEVLVKEKETLKMPKINSINDVMIIFEEAVKRVKMTVKDGSKCPV
uniref:Sphingomyelin phosphodiesterase n=1 Tax=Panagrolaimus sp. ES5 TaxID=591445 RepID=A0AC34FVR2_9BILA